MVSLSENGWPSLRNKKEVLTKFCAVIETVILTNAADRMNLNMGVYFERKIRNLEMKSLIGKSTPNRRIPIIQRNQSSSIGRLINSDTFISLAHSMFYFCTHENYAPNCNTCTLFAIHDIFPTTFPIDESPRRTKNSHCA